MSTGARRRFEAVTQDEQLPVLERTVVREDVKLYADASGDQNPLHQDDAFARGVGFDGIIAHGMFTMGHLTSCITRWSGDASAILRMRVSFRTAVMLSDVMVAGGRVKSLDPAARTATLEVWVRVDRDGQEEFPIRRSEAVVQLA